MFEQPTRRTTRLVVADAGPLIHLDELECLWLLGLFSEVQIPDAVWHEVIHHRPQALLSSGVNFVRCALSPSQRIEALSTLYTLHVGEYEALCRCLDSADALLLTDDTAARLAAKTLTIEARGTIGILVQAIRQNQLEKAEVIRLLSEIPTRSTLHIRLGFLMEIIRQVAESSETR